jgi:hypothetical protein
VQAGQITTPVAVAVVLLGIQAPAAQAALVPVVVRPVQAGAGAVVRAQIQTLPLAVLVVAHYGTVLVIVVRVAPLVLLNPLKTEILDHH